MDLLRALILGPVDTPYCNGCFIFDILLPQVRWGVLQIAASSQPARAP